MIKLKKGQWVNILDRYGAAIIEGRITNFIEYSNGITNLKIKDYPTVCDICEPPKAFKTHNWWKKHMKKTHNVEVDK